VPQLELFLRKQALALGIMKYWIIRFFFAIYRFFLSPALHLICGPTYGCRFIPSCSQFAHESLQRHGFILGGILMIRRVLRCHPFACAGYDPVPHVIRKIKVLND
jgi:putative membrane protein insertion efficiency factor